MRLIGKVISVSVETVAIGGGAAGAGDWGWKVQRLRNFADRITLATELGLKSSLPGCQQGVMHLQESQIGVPQYPSL